MTGLQEKWKEIQERLCMSRSSTSCQALLHPTETDVVQPVAGLVELPRESMCMEEFSRGVDIQAILDAIMPQYACAPTAGQRQPGRGHLAYLAHRGRLLPCLVHDHGHDLLGYSLDSPAEARCAEPAV